MRRAVRWGIPVVLVLLILAYGLISFLIASGVTKAERKDQEDNPAAHGLEFEEVTFLSRKGDVNLGGWYIADNEDGPTLIFVHGIGSNRSDNDAVELAARLVERGFDVLLFDLRAHGTSGGDQVTGGQFERLDALGAFDFLVERGVQPEDIGLLGFSMGAGTSLLAAADEPEIRALVVDSPYARATELIAQETARKTIFPQWVVPVFIPTTRLMAHRLFGIDLGFLVPEDAAAKLSYPILVIHGTADTRIPTEHGERVYAAAPAGSEIWLVPGVDHVDAFKEYPDEYVDRLTGYFEERLDVPVGLSNTP